MHQGEIGAHGDIACSADWFKVLGCYAEHAVGLYSVVNDLAILGRTKARKAV